MKGGEKLRIDLRASTTGVVWPIRRVAEEIEYILAEAGDVTMDPRTMPEHLDAVGEAIQALFR